MTDTPEVASEANAAPATEQAAKPLEFERMAVIRERYEHGVTNYEVMVHPDVLAVFTAGAAVAAERAKATADAGVNTSAHPAG